MGGKNIRVLKGRLKSLQRIKTWQLLIVLFFSLILAATLLRFNNLGMIDRRQAVIDADKKGDRVATKQALVDLQRYVSSHMNTSLGSGVYLENAYQIDRAAAIAAATEASNPNSAVYQQASIECRSRFVGGVASFRNDYVRCVIDRVSSLSADSQAAQSANLPRLDSYKYNFASPVLSFDLAGFAVLFCLFVTGVIVVRILALIALRFLLRQRYREA